MRSGRAAWPIPAFLLGALAPAGCQPLEVDYRDLETRRGDGVVVFQGAPFNGVAVRYGDLGSLVERATY